MQVSQRIVAQYVILILVLAGGGSSFATSIFTTNGRISISSGGDGRPTGVVCGGVCAALVTLMDGV